MNESPFGRHRYFTFCGARKEWNLYFPEIYVKVSELPPFPYMAVADESGGRIVSVPGEIRIWLSSPGCDHLYDADAISVIKECYLTLSDSIDIITRWVMTGVKMRWQGDEWTINYDECKIDTTVGEHCYGPRGQTDFKTT